MVKNIMCALSGGGFRAMFFHAGVLRALVRLGLKQQIAAISTVSGGSITGVLFSLRYQDIHSISDFDRLVLAPLVDLSRRKLGPKLLLHNIARLPTRLLSILLELLGFPGRFVTSLDRYNSTMLFISELDDLLYGKALLSDLPASPELRINTTNLNNGTRWRFTKSDFGDYKTGYSYNIEQFKLSEAVAASAGYPLLFPPYKLRTGEYTFYFRNQAKNDLTINHHVPQTVYLSDGGIYDNLGIHALKNQLSLTEPCFLVISDASSSLSPLNMDYGYLSACKRIVDILLEQVVSHDRQIITANFTNQIWRGIFFRLENSTSHYRQSTELGAVDKIHIPVLGLSDDMVSQLRDISTSATVFTSKQLCSLVHHGETLTETLLASWHTKDYLQLLHAPGYTSPAWINTYKAGSRGKRK